MAWGVARGHMLGITWGVTPIYPEWSGYGIDMRSMGILYRYTPTIGNSLFSPFVGFEGNAIITDRHSEYSNYTGETVIEVSIRILPWSLNRLGFTLVPRWQIISVDRGKSFQAWGVTFRLTFFDLGTKSTLVKGY